MSCSSSLIRVQSTLNASEFQVLLIEGFHYRQPQIYFRQLLRNFCLISWFASPEMISVTSRERQEQKGEQINSITSACMRQRKEEQKKSEAKEVHLKERKKLADNQIFYTLAKSKKDTNNEDKIDVLVELRLEVSISNQQGQPKTFIRIKIVPSQNDWTSQLFPQWSSYMGKQLLYSHSFCEFSSPDELLFPYFKQEAKIAQNDKNNMILLVNQKHIKEMPFFVSYIKHLIEGGRKLPKIIGHPISLMLVLLINEKQEYDTKVGEVINNYRELLKEVKIPAGMNTTKKPQEHLYSLIQRTLGQQNLLEPSFIDFFAQNMANQAFSQDFIHLVQLYYQIFMDQILSQSEINQALAHNFYSSPEDNNTIYFSSILKSIEFKHDLYYKTLAGALSKYVKISGQKTLLQMTLEELYRYNKVEFSFVGLDVDDQVVRFFNYMTAPQMPVAAILSLSQILPTPFKAIRWRPQWGHYIYHSNNRLRMLNITNHEIIDSRFLLQCPIDLLQDRLVLSTYFDSNCPVDTPLQAIVSSRIKVQDLMHIDEIKKLLKSMKSNAIDSLPKLKLIWKILTTKNRVDIDINQIQTLYQIPILEKILKINETFKYYLINLNKEVNESHICKLSLRQYGHRKHKEEEIKEQVRRLKKLIEQHFVSGAVIQLVAKDKKHLQKEVSQMQAQIKGLRYISMSQMMRLLAAIKNMLKSYNIKHKYMYRNSILEIEKEINRWRNVLDIQQVRSKMLDVLYALRQAQFKDGSKLKDSELRTSTVGYRQTYHYQYAQNLSFQPLLARLDTFEQSITKLNPETHSQHTTQTLNFHFRRLLYNISLDLTHLLSTKIQSQRLKVFYSQLFEVTPQLFNLQQILQSNFYHNDLIRQFLMNQYEGKSLHLILKSKAGTLLEQAHHLINMREIISQLKMQTISSISSSGFSSILAFLFCLNINKDDLLKQVIGWQDLVKTRSSGRNQLNIDIKQLLARKVDTQQKLYCQSKDNKLGQLRNKLTKKYMSLNQHFKTLEELYRGPNYYKLQNIYSTINNYDQHITDDQIILKQQMIKIYLSRENQIGQEKRRGRQLLRNNEEMLGEKIQFNKIGLKFIIHFLYHEPTAALNWQNIHKKQYQDLNQFKTHLCLLFKKYNIPLNITLKQFNQTNHHKIKLNFNLINQQELTYESITEEKQPYVKVLDLLVAAISDPVYFGAYPLQIQHVDKLGHYQRLMGKIQKEVGSSMPERRYWSNNTLNPLPFNMVSPLAQQQTVLGLDLCPFELDAMEPTMPGQNSDSLRFKPVNVEDGDKKLTAIDLISFWWTKPKKLTPQLKKIMFGNIYQSPYMKFYFFIQNHSYQHLNSCSNRSLMHLNDDGDEYKLKAESVAEIVLNKERFKCVLKVKNNQQEDCFEVQCIKKFMEKRVLVVAGQEQLTENIIGVIKEKNKVELRIIDGSKEGITVSYFLLTKQQLNKPLFLSISAQKQQTEPLKINKLQISNGILTNQKYPVKILTKSYLYHQCTQCGQPFAIEQTEKQTYQCRMCKKSKQFRLNFFVDLGDGEQSVGTERELASEGADRRENVDRKKKGWFDCLCCFGTRVAEE